MTLRDYFAAKAMTAIVIDFLDQGCDLAKVAASSYEMADAMLREREKHTE